MSTKNQDLQHLRNLRIQQLLLIVELERFGSLARAAAALNLTQSAATKNIKGLESLFDTPLFHRHGAGMTATRAGAVMLNQAKRVLANLQRCDEQIKRVADGHSGHLRIGTLIAASPTLLPRALSVLASEFPDVSVAVIEGTEDRLQPQLANGDIDIIVGRTGNRLRAANLQAFDLYRDPIVIVTRDSNPLVVRKPKTLAGLAEARWILPPPNTALRAELDVEFRHAGIDVMRGAVESVALSTNLTLLQMSDMVAALPRQIYLKYAGDYELIALPIRLKSVTAKIGYTLPIDAPPSPVVENFVSILKREAIELT